MGGQSSALEAVFRPVQRARTLDETVKRLGTAIRLGVLSPGSRLPPERDLANRLRINRSTLHEALTTLVQDGYLVALRGRGGGTFVAEAPPLSTGRAPESPGDGVRAVLDQRVAIEMGANHPGCRAGDTHRPRPARAGRRANGSRQPLTTIAAPMCVSTSGWRRRRTRRGSWPP